MTRKVTYVSMVYTDGREHGYSVYRTVLHEPKTQKPFVDLSRASLVDTVYSTVSPRDFDYLALAKQHETAEYPAFAFGQPIEPRAVDCWTWAPACGVSQDD